MMDLQNMNAEEQNVFNLEKCQQCNQVFHINDADPNYEGIVATYDNERYCTFSCIIKDLSS